MDDENGTTRASARVVMPTKWIFSIIVVILSLMNLASERLTTANTTAIPGVEIREAIDVRFIEQGVETTAFSSTERPAQVDKTDSTLARAARENFTTSMPVEHSHDISHDKISPTTAADNAQTNTHGSVTGLPPQNLTIIDRDAVPPSRVSESSIALSNASSSGSSQAKPYDAVEKSVNSTTINSSEKMMVFSHYFGHIPKSGSSFAFGAISKLVYDLPEYKRLDQSDKFRPCNEGHKYHGQWRNFHQQYGGVRCNFWMTEPGKYNKEALHQYVILREPISHTLSMYFHCTESRDHASRAQFMPSTLEEWIQAWHASYNGTIKPWKNRKRFQCYNPIDFQARATHFDPELGKEDIRKKWDIIGDNSQMDKTICLIVIKYTGWVPKQCDCSSNSSNDKKQRRRRLNELVYNPDQHAHGVTHHGSTYNITESQRQMITDFRGRDIQLYNLLVTEIFEEQVREAEVQHNFTLCNKLRLEPKEVTTN